MSAVPRPRLNTACSSGSSVSNFSLLGRIISNISPAWLMHELFFGSWINLSDCLLCEVVQFLDIPDIWPAAVTPPYLEGSLGSDSTQ